MKELLADLTRGVHTGVALDVPGVRYELVDHTYVPTNYAPDALLRTVRQVAAELFEVRVVAADGVLRMSGTYRDAALQVPHGSFEYHYVDGQLESRGDYDLGNKSGIWERYGSDGRRLADRVYLGLSMEQIQVALGQSEEACTGDGVH